MSKSIKVWDGSVWQNVGTSFPDTAGLATESYVSNAIASLVNSAPSTLDTLNELAAALNNDASYASTITTALGTKAPLESPTFTGTVDFSGATVTGIVALPTQTGNSGKYLTTNGTDASWSTLTLSDYATKASPSFTGSVSINGYMTETMTISNSAAGSTVDYDILTNNNILYYTSNATSNWTLNIRGNSSTSLDSIMSNNQVLTVIFLVTNGSTAYYQTGFQIDGTSVTPKWLGASPMTSGSASSIDIYELTIIKTASNTYTVLESSSRFA